MKSIGSLKPVFIVGPERSGTTLLYSILANASEFYWFSRIDSLLPSYPLIAEAGRRCFHPFEKKPFLAHEGKISSIRGINNPSECNAYWKRYFGWGTEDNYRIKDDRFKENGLGEDKRIFIENDFKKRLKYSGRKRMLLKQPGFSLKLPFWNWVFPNAYYLICVRNIEENISSLVEAKKGASEEFWGTKIEEWETYKKADYDVQAMIQLREIYSKMAKDLENDYIRKRTRIVSYDQLLTDPANEIRRITEFCEIKWNQRMKLAAKGIVRERTLNTPDPKPKLPAHNYLNNLAKKVDDLLPHN